MANFVPGFRVKHQLLRLITATHHKVAPLSPSERLTAANATKEIQSRSHVIPSHPSLVLHPNAAELEINLNLTTTTGAGILRTSADRTFTYIDSTFIDILDRYVPTVSRVKLNVIFNHSRNEARSMQRDQAKLLRWVFHKLNSFRLLTQFEIRYTMPDSVMPLGQIKTLAFFYRMHFTDWIFKSKVGNTDAWDTLEVGSDLDTK
ncbi:hypothetical protein BJ875DRAFT_539136 [Amylocarpus encephaloides]|uniref:Uncharacterized protein n=1 Tax=Amylocarpus encephaloides TaxID=45428 RepID=A0A9P8CB94_9HELO|nr:hypothetical protein BJ875DRAFT_539136 [Amylocarpus encephaloides]